MVDAKDPRVTSTHGHDPDAKGPAPGPIDPKTGQHTSYWILTEAERAKGFVRPVRRSYIHTGIRPVHPLRDLTDVERENYAETGYVKFEVYPESVAGRGRYWTQAELKSGCGALTSMPQAIAETYASQPTFYGNTMCVHCGTHFPVAEFTWDGAPDQIVGS